MAGNKYTRGGSNSFDIKPTDDSILIGEVIDIDDPNDGGRIKVFIKGLDDKEFDFNNSGDIGTKKELSHLPHAFPLLPKFLNVMPKIGESVFVLLTNKDNKYSGRMWIGPIISQPESLDEDPYLSSLSNLTQGFLNPKEKLRTKSHGAYPMDKGYFLKECIALQGRNNSDLIFRDNEITLRAGKFEVDNKLIFNKKNIGYIQIKHDVTIDSKNDTKGTVTNIVSDKINLLSHLGIENFNITNKDELIKDSEMEKILEKAQSLVYGDKLVEFLILLQKYVVGHSHYYNGREVVADRLMKDVNDFTLEDLLSKNIRIN